MRTCLFAGLAASCAAGVVSAQTPTYSLTDLSPTDPPTSALESFINGAGSSQAVGQISVAIDGPAPDSRRPYAMLWDQTSGGGSGGWTSLDPGPQYSGSYAFGCRNGQQVGYGFISGPNLALLWTGTGASAVVLNGPGVENAVAYATDGQMQVGSGSSDVSGGVTWAYVWNGTPESGRPIHPTNFMLTSIAQATRGGRIVGTGDDFGEMRAGLYWENEGTEAVMVRPDGFEETFCSDLAGDYIFGDGSGPAVSGRHAILFPIADPIGPNWIDLHPSDPSYVHSYSSAALVSGESYTLVGQAAFLVNPDTGERYEHACVWLWNGNPEATPTFIDLHTATSDLPAEFVLSKATGLDDAGNIYGWATDLQGHYLALRWSPDGTPACPADFNADGFIDFFDYSDYVTAFEEGGAGADFNGDGFVDFFDYSDYVAAFEEGC